MKYILIVLSLVITVSCESVSLEDQLLDSVNRQNLELTKSLINKGANINVREDEGWTSFRYPDHWTSSFTPLHIAACLGNKELVLMLLKNDADPNIKTSKGQTALDLAKFYEPKKGWFKKHFDEDRDYRSIIELLSSPKKLEQIVTTDKQSK